MAKSERDAEKVVKFLTKLRSNWGKRFESEEAEDSWLETMIHELGGFSAEVLDAAAASLLRSKLDFFPRLGQCLEACDKAKKDRDMRQPGFWAQTIKAEAAGRNFSLAYELLKTKDGREAVRGNWQVGFFWFVVREGRLPDASEKRKLHEAAEDFDKFYPDLCRGAAFPKPERGLGIMLDQKRAQTTAMEAMWIKMADQIHQKRKELAAIALGEAVS